MQSKCHLIYWKSDCFWLGKLFEYPEVITQGETLEELEENIRDAYQLIVFDGVPARASGKRNRVMKRTAFIQWLQSKGCVLVRHGARHIKKHLGLSEE